MSADASATVVAIDPGFPVDILATLWVSEELPDSKTPALYMAKKTLDFSMIS
jgi:hypothetical protein